MKTGLPIILGIAWAPIIWIIVISTAGQILFAFTGSWLFTQGATLILVILATFLFLRFFRVIGRKINGESHEKA